MARTDQREPFALVGGYLGTALAEVTTDLGALDHDGRWAVAISFEGQVVCARFRSWRPVALPQRAEVLRDLSVGAWPGIGPESWTSSLDVFGFTAGVRAIRDAIEAGDVYQVNLTRRLSSELPAGADVTALATRLARLHPAPFAATISLPAHGIGIVSASPERFLERVGRRIRSSPIKGTASTASRLTPKDQAENIMIVDLVRNDLGRVCDYGTVTAERLLELEHHPGLVHLVSHVEGQLRPGMGWPEILAATFPPGSVTGAPKLAAQAMIERLEPTNRRTYCGAVGWVDAARACGELNVAIRTFWTEAGALHLGTGGGITWDSTPSGEWDETVLKAARLVEVAAGVEGATP